MNGNKKVDTNASLDLQSLTGYGRPIHARTGGVCEYCGFGEELVLLNWLQMTVEHVIPSSWFPNGWEEALRALFGSTVAADQWPRKYMRESRKRELIGCRLMAEVQQMVCTTACHFCNSATSRWDKKGDKNLQCRFQAVFTDEEVRRAERFEDRRDILLRKIESIRTELLARKKEAVFGKLAIARVKFDSVKPELCEKRRSHKTAGGPSTPV